MTFVIKHKPLPGSPMLCEYECQVHGIFELLVDRDENGDPPQHALCEDDVDHGDAPEIEGLWPDRDWCGRRAELVIGAPKIKFWSRDPVALGRASKSDEKDPRALDTEPLATGKMTKAEWRKYQRGITLERRYQKQIKSGRRQKRIQVGGG